MRHSDQHPLRHQIVFIEVLFPLLVIASGLSLLAGRLYIGVALLLCAILSVALAFFRHNLWSRWRRVRRARSQQKWRNAVNLP